MDYMEAKRFQFQFECAECGSEPQIYPIEGGYEARCQNKSHKGLIRQKSYVKARLERMIKEQNNIVKEEK